MTPDLKGLHYLTSPNMAQLDVSGKAPMIENDGDMLSYNPWSYRCCQHNVSIGWPYFAEHLWMATHDNGLAAVFYAANSVKAKVADGSEVQISETTQYPFGDVVEFKLSVKRRVRFPFLVRVPSWCKGARIQLNGKEIGVALNPAAWVRLERIWRNGDVVHLELPQAIALSVWEKDNNSVSVSRGPLVYSLKIGERWEQYGGTDRWPAYQVFPSTPWNYGLVADLENPEASFELVRKSDPLPTQPFTLDNAPLELKAKGKRIPQWKLESNGLIGALQDSPVYSTEASENITLIPMGCARLRVSAFPRTSESPGANRWK